MGDTKLSLCAQWLLMLLDRLPRSTAQYPRSASFRLAAREFAARAGLPLSPSRGELERAAIELQRKGSLPAWVVLGGGPRAER